MCVCVFISLLICSVFMNGKTVKCFVIGFRFKCFIKTGKSGIENFFTRAIYFAACSSFIF